MLLRFLAIPIVVLGVIGALADISWWLLAALGAASALALIAADAIVARRQRHRRVPPL